jgi:hypothetical protein
MTTSINISRRLDEWATLAGYTLTPGASTADGRAMFWSAGGEVRYFIGASDNGWFVLTDSDRLGPEHFKLAADSMITMEKYLFGKFGAFIRNKRNLPRIEIPIAKEDVATGFSIDYRPYEDGQRTALVGPNGSILAFSSADLLYGTMELVGLSIYLTASIDDITAAFLSPDGRPLFSLR